MKYVWIPILISVVVASVVVLGSGSAVFVGIPFCWIAAILTLAGWLACIKAYGNPKIQAESNIRITRRQVWLGTFASAIAIVGCVLLAMAALSRTREYSKSAVSASNLRGIGAGLEIYHQNYGDYPASLNGLVATGINTWGQFHAVGDPDVPYNVPEEQTQYSSYVYQPGKGEWQANPKLILSYERSAWTLLELRILPRYGRHVLFADGRVRRLGAEAFAAAKRKDGEARKALGWPRTVAQ